MDSRYQLPTDSAENRLLLSVHDYDPSGYCIQGSLNSWGTQKDYAQMNGMLAKLTQFTRQGVGDTYDPTQASEGLVTTDVQVTGPGVYTVGLDFTGCEGGYVTGTVFSALAISNGEVLFPKCYINLKEVVINGEKYPVCGRTYTSSDDGKCTRVDLYNSWVPTVPKEARILGNNLTGATPTLLNNDDPQLQHIETLFLTFELVVPGAR